MPAVKKSHNEYYAINAEVVILPRTDTVEVTLVLSGGTGIILSSNILLIKQYAASRGIEIAEIDEDRRTVSLRGTKDVFQEAFGAFQSNYDTEQSFRKTQPELDQAIEVVFGLNDGPTLVPYTDSGTFLDNYRRTKQQKGYYPHELSRLYNFPEDVDGSGQSIALIELGGGYRLSEVQDYFTRLGLPIPSLSAVNVDGCLNEPGLSYNADREVMLDILMAGSIAPAAKIAVYFAPNTERGFYDAVTKAIHNPKNKPSIISISWGAAEKKWTKKSLNSFNEAFKIAAEMGVTICVASGDHGSCGGIDDGNVHVSFPASSPYVLSCGGTHMTAKNGAILSEVVWHEGDGAASGGGISEIFDRPAYQAHAGVPVSINLTRFAGRGVPDVAGHAAHGNGYKITLNGKDIMIGGTSAVAPMYAGLIALLNQKQGYAYGFINPLLYQNPHLFREILKGNNITVKQQKGYIARPGWNACTGLGVFQFV